MFAWAAIPDQFPRTGMQIRLGILDRLRKGRGCRPVKDADPGAWAFGDFDAVQPGAFVLASGTDRPDLARRQRGAGEWSSLCSSGVTTNFSTPSWPSV